MRLSHPSLYILLCVFFLTLLPDLTLISVSYSPARVKTALEGSKVHLECGVITSDPDVKVEWILPDLSLVEEANEKIEISEKGGLVILNGSLADSGVYHCMIRSKAGVDLMPLRLSIKQRSLGPTAFNGQKVTVEKGKSLSLHCDVASVQPSQTLWYMPKNQVLHPTQKTKKAEVFANGTLAVRKLTLEDAGEYSCLASNLYGVDMLSHVVEISSDGTLVLNKVTLADEGKYTCVARNSAGDDVKDMKIEVESQEPFINAQAGCHFRQRNIPVQSLQLFWFVNTVLPGGGDGVPSTNHQ
uniref:Ig-like domain-containing protein n=1 Tax=Salarias fasciatus TaxID=181472 RepID=A0A672G3T5_SALFA